MSRQRQGEPRDFLLGLTREADLGHDEAWHTKFSALQLATIEAYHAHSDFWKHMPSLTRYREVPKGERCRVAEAFAKGLASAIGDGAKPAVICVERPWVEGFIRGILEQPLSGAFVLLVVNGGDAPLTADLQEQIAGLPGLRACFANNLHAPRAHGLFHPLPLGVTGEASLRRVREAARPWERRDRRLLITPMRSNNRFRKRYLEILSGAEYGELVRIVSGHLPHDAFLELLSEHQCILSPPGRGYDCGRTWQALAVGCVPLVVEDRAFDQRLHLEAGPVFVPPPELLTPDALEDVLSNLGDPSRYLDKLEMGHWRKLWSSYLP